MKSLIAHLALFAAMLAAAAETPAPITVPGQRGPAQTYTVSGVPESYWLRIFAETDRPGPQQNARIAVGEARPVVRRIIAPAAREGHFTVERVRLGRSGTTVRIEVEPEVKITKLVFEPVPRKLPPEAAKYVPTVKPRPDRPRLLVNRELLPVIRDRLKRGENSAAWREVREIAEKPFPFTVPEKGEVQDDAALIDAMKCKAFYYLMTGNGKIGREACELAVRYFAVVNFGNGQDICRRIGAAIFAASCVYDWCYPLMTDAERAALRDRFLWQAEAMEIGWPPFLEHINIGHGSEWQLNRDLLAMAIAVYDEDPVPWRYCAYRLLEEAAPRYRQLYRAGWHYEGSSYGAMRYGVTLLAALLLKRACGIDLYEPYVGKVAYSWLYLQMPDNRLFCIGDCPTPSMTEYGNPRRPNPEMLLASNTLWPDGKLQHEYFRVLAPRAKKYDDPVWFLLCADPDLRPDARRDDLPLVRYVGDPVSALFARTGWNMGLASEDTVVALNGAGAVWRSHAHFDAGAFQLYYRGLLAADLGQYRYFARPYDLNFAKSSMAHSVLRLVDPKQKKSLMRRVKITSGVQETAVNGGPATLREITSEYDKFARGKVLSVSTDPAAPHFKLDLAKSYPKRAKKYVRTMVVLAAEKPALVVFDEVEPTAARIKPVWQLTTFDTPVEKDGKLVAEHRFFGLPSRLTVTTLLPRRAEKKILSGKAAHTVEGVYYAPPYPNLPHARGSRTEITAAKGESAARFLHVLQPTPGTESAPVEMTEKDGVLTLVSDGWTLELAPGKAPKATVAKPARNAPPPRDTVYLDGRIVGKVEAGRVPLAELLKAKQAVYSEKSGQLEFDGFTLADGREKVSRADGKWLVPADTAARLLNADATVDRQTASIFFASRPGEAVSRETAVDGRPSVPWHDLVENGEGSFVAPGKVVGTVVFRRAKTLSGVLLRFVKGDSRRTKLKIEVSPDGQDFAAVFDGESSGRERDFEKFAFPAQKAAAVRITFFGNHENKWNSVSGLRFEAAR